jgi:hypothetical protein
MEKRTLFKVCWLVIFAVLFSVGGFTDAEAKRTISVDTPLTRLLANGFTSQQVVDLLEDAGLSGLSRRHIYKDPMAGLTGLESFTDEQVKLLQASTAVNLFLLRLDNYAWGPGDPGDTAYLAESVQMVQDCLNQARFEDVRNQLSPALADFAKPLTADHLIKATDNLTKTLTLLARKGEISDPVAETRALVDSLSELALHYYVQDNRGDAAIEEAISYDILPDISDNQYPQVDLAGWVTVYNEDGTKAISESGTTADPEPVTYPAATLQTVGVDGNNFVLTWALPGSASEVPSGGYDIIIDGTDTGSQWRTEQTSVVISGLEADVEHTFQIQTRWLQAEPDLVLLSNELSAINASVVVEPEPEPELNPYPTAILETVQVDGSDFVLNWSLPDGTSSVPSGGYDIIIDGTDTGSEWRTEQNNIVISGLEADVEHSFQIQARWLQADPDLVPLSNVLTAINTTVVTSPVPDPEPVTYPAAILDTVEFDGGDFVLNWSLPGDTSEVPSGGYDIIIDGTDTGIQWRTEQTSVVISGLNADVEHSFQIQARWLQAEPDQALLSNVLSAISTPIVAEPIAYPAAILQTVEEDGSNFVLNWSLPGGTADVPSGGYDIIIDGTDTGSEWRTEQASVVISGLEAGVEHSFQIQTRWLQAEPDLVPVSNELSGTITSSTPAPPVEPNPTEPNPDAVEPPSSTNSGAVKVFPGAVGFGTETVAGRGGQIIKVTNLNDSGSGSLRAAIETSGARTIVFEVGGAINLGSDLRISNGYCTIAGQTAPFPGIMLKGYGLRISTSHVLLQHLAIRVGDDGRTANGSWDNADALQITGSGSSNIVVDHCSLSWAIDENASIWASNAHDITFSNNIIAEGLMDSVHTEQPHSKGLLIGGASNNPKYVAIIGNLLAHNLDRNPQLKGGTTTVVANNLIFNYGGLPYTGYGANMTRNYVSERILASFVGNVYIDGQDTPSGSYAIASNSTLTSDSKIYAYDNVNHSRPSYMLNSSAKSYEVSSPPVSISDFLPLSSNKVIDSVLSYTGARPAERDDADARIVNEVVTGNGVRKNHSSGLWPSYPQASRDFDQFIPASPNGDDDGDGYTNIEEVLYAMARQVEGR